MDLEILSLMHRYIAIHQRSYNDSASPSKIELNSATSKLLDLIPIEWLTLYEANFRDSTANQYKIDPGEAKRIEKDLTRTFSLFSKDPIYASIFNSDRIIEKIPQQSWQILGFSFLSPFTVSGSSKSSVSPSLEYAPSQQIIYIDHLKIVLTTACQESGYCQGMNFLAAKLLLIENDPMVAFIVLSFILRQRHLLVLFDPHNSCLMDYMNIFHKRLRRHNRIVYRHLKLINFPPLCFTIEWFTTCFIVSSPGNLSTLVLDLIVAGFDDVMMDVGLALLDIVQEKVVSLTMDGMQNGFKALLHAVDPMAVLERAMLIREKSMREKRYTLDGVNILKMMYEIFLEKAEPTAEFIRDQHPYRRLRSSHGTVQSKMSSAETESGDSSPVEYVSSGDDERSVQEMFLTKSLGTSPAVSSSSGIGKSVVRVSPSRKRRMARRRQRSAKRMALTTCSQQYLSQVDYRRYLEAHFGECDFSIHCLDTHIHRRRSERHSFSRSPAAADGSPVAFLSLEESDTNEIFDGTSNAQQGEGSNSYEKGPASSLSQSNGAYHQRDDFNAVPQPLVRSTEALPSSPQEPSSSGWPHQRAKPLRRNTRNRICRIHWNEAMLSITEDWFFQ